MPSSLRLNMTGAESEPSARSARYQAAIDMAEYADKHGFDYINVEEHHCAQNGWLPSPLTMASAIAARTEKAGIGIMALLVSLYDPVRLAEDLAVIDLISRGRLSFIAGLGYREIEFHALDKPFAERGKWMDHVLDTLLKAWGDEPFEYRGEMITVTPKPYTPPQDFSLWFIDENPDTAWAEIGHHFLNEVQEYNSWKRAGLARPMEMPSASVEEIRASGRYEIVTPEECIERMKADKHKNAVLHPLVGGMPLERGWRSLELYCEKVLPEVG